MEYNEFIEKVLRLDFILDEEQADLAIKAVLGIFLTSLPSEHAYWITENLPYPLTYDNLRKDPKPGSIPVSMDELVDEVMRTLVVQKEQSRVLVNLVLHVLRPALNQDILGALKSDLSSEWINTLLAA